MKKNLLTLALATASLLTIVSCGSTPNSSNRGSETGTSQRPSYSDEEPHVTELELLSPPTRTDYMAGEKFDPTGILIKAYWSHGLYEDDIKKNDITWAPKGELQVTDTKVTVYYEGLSLDIPITVAGEAKLVSLKMTKQPFNHINLGETLIMSGFVIEGQYNNGKTTEITDYAVTLNGTDVTSTLKTGIKNLALGTHTFTITASGLTTSFNVEVIDYTTQTHTRVEADNLLTASEITAESKNYVEKTNSIIKESDKNAANGSNGYSLSRIFLYTTINLHYYSETDGNVALIVQGASTSRNKSTGRMTDIYVNTVAELTLNDAKNTPIDNGAYFKGIGTSSQWFSWYTTYFGTFPVKKGDNLFKFYLFNEQEASPGSKGEDGGATLFNLDYFDFIQK